MELIYRLHLTIRALCIYSSFKTYIMLPENILQSDLLDILFENRNKTYGAYTLRRSYNKTIATAISVTFFIATIFAVLQLTHHVKQRDHVIPFIIDDPNLTQLDNTILSKPEVPAQPPSHPHTTVNQEIYSTPVIADIPETQAPTIDDLINSTIGGERTIGNGDVNVVQSNSVLQETGVSESTTPEVKDEGPFYSAQVMPEYPGGIEALKKFMLKNLRQPDDLQAGEKIIVMASFVVNKNGEIEQVKIINNGRADLNKEVQRVINKMPLWKPGIQNGNAVSVYFNLPVTFMSVEEE